MRSTFTFALVAALASPSPAAALEAEARFAGNKGHVSAWAADMSTALAVEACAARGLSWDYIPCGQRLRRRMKARSCTGPVEARTWYYQIGDGTKLRRVEPCTERPPSRPGRR